MRLLSELSINEENNPFSFIFFPFKKFIFLQQLKKDMRPIMQQDDVLDIADMFLASLRTVYAKAPMLFTEKNRDKTDKLCDMQLSGEEKRYLTELWQGMQTIIKERTITIENTPKLQEWPDRDKSKPEQHNARPPFFVFLQVVESLIANILNLIKSMGINLNKKHDDSSTEVKTSSPSSYTR